AFLPQKTDRLPSNYNCKNKNKYPTYNKSESAILPVRPRTTKTAIDCLPLSRDQKISDINRRVPNPIRCSVTQIEA
ncbi:35530_t:CDS:1, partial [Racocetra persica]